MKSCFVGIDVAFAKRKRLPIAICTWEDGRLVPLPLRRLHITPPRGRGNVAAIDPTAVAEFADETYAYVVEICNYFALRVAAIAIDAPSSARSDGVPRRAAEVAMDKAGISCFATPSYAEWGGIRARVEAHLAAGGVESRLPHANQLWMLPGFALFKRLRTLAPVLEVFPQAIARALGSGSLHKSKAGAVKEQLLAAARHTGWPRTEEEEKSLSSIAWAPRHDCLDAYLAAWLAALEEQKRVPYGNAPDDVIWVPQCT